MNSPRGIKKRSIGALLACCLIVAPGMVVTTAVLPGCDGGAGFLGLQDYQRDLLFGAGSLAIALLGGGAPADGAGQAITPGCTIEDNEDGSSTITCIQINADGSSTSTAVTVRSGESSVCTIADNEDGSATITCDDGTEVVVRNGTDGVNGTSCSVTDNPDDTITISCTDGTSATFKEGRNGSDGRNGSNGSDGSDGADGESCTVSETETEIAINCGTNSVIIKKFGAVPLFDNLFIDAFFTPNGGSFAEASARGSLDPQSVFEPALGPCGVETVAYKMGVPERYNMAGAGNPITMRLFIYRTGDVDGCAVLRLDGFRAVHGETILTYGDPRYISLDLSEINEVEEEVGVLLVVDLPLNNGTDLMKSLGFPTPNGGDLLAFELNTVEGRFNDGGCYTMLGVDFFESAADDGSVAVANADVFASLDDITGCGDCVVSDYFDRPDSNDVGGGFTEFEADDDDVAIVGGMLRLRDDGDPFDDPELEQVEAQAILFGQDVSGFVDLTLAFAWTSLGGSVPTDKFYVQWRACDDPANISTNSEIGTSAFLDFFETPALFERVLQNGPFLPDSEMVELPLPQAALDAGCIDLRFVTIVSQPEEGVLIDFIDLCGTPAEPEPGYVCVDFTCLAVDDDAEYATLEECNSNCFELEPGYVCVDFTCLPVEDDAEFATLDDCNSNCFEPVVRYDCVGTPGAVGTGIGCIPSETGQFTSLIECEEFCSLQDETVQ